MDEPDGYELAKMEIRGLLISNKEGCSLSEFKKQYRSMLGRDLPFAQFGYKTDIELLSKMKDAVNIISTGRDYYLYGIADEKSKHIQKMVSKQKPSKKKPLGRLNTMQRSRLVLPSAPRRTSTLPPSSAPRWSNELATPKKSNEFPSSVSKRSYELPPRFQTNGKVKKEFPQFEMDKIVNLVCKYPCGLNLRDVLVGYRRLYKTELPFKEYGFFTLQECLEKIPSIILKPKDNDTLVLLLPDEGKSYLGSSKASNKVSGDFSSTTHNKIPGASPTVQNSEYSGLSPTAALNRPNYEQPSYGPFSVLECPSGLSFTPDINRPNSELPSYDPFSVLDYPSGFSFTPGINRPYSEISSFDPFSALDYPTDMSKDLCPDLSRIPSPHNSTNSKQNASFSSENHNATDLKMKADHLDDIRDEDSPVSENIMNNLFRVVESCPHGIWAREFPILYKEITKTELDLHSLGYYNLASFVDSVPDILTRRSLPNSKKDYLIYPAWTRNEMDPEDPKSAAFAIEIIIFNTRKILQASEEGIKLKDFIYVYSLNCKEPLYFLKLGFDNIEGLLVAIADRVPLKFEMKGDVKWVHLDTSETNSLLPPPVDLESPPPGFVSPFEHFTQQNLPPDLDLSQFFAIYVSSVMNPSRIYIQLQGENTSDALIKKYQDLEQFYASQSKSYMMKDAHITAGSIGVAQWPVDKHWYRIRIMSVISLEKVQVFYVDYGTIEIISKTLVRYIRKEFFDLPAQAIKASLAYVKPPLGENTWSVSAKRRILELCTDITVMAKIHDIEQDGVLSLVLCDTNGKEDVYINDVLLNERLACNSSDADSQPQCRIPQEPPQCVPEIPPSLPPPQLPSANTADPTKVFEIFLQAYTSLAANKASSAVTPNIPLDPKVLADAIVQTAQSISQSPSTSGVNFPNQFQASSPDVLSPIPCPKAPSDDSCQLPLTSHNFAGGADSDSSSPSGESSEVFDDDDDAFFDEFLSKVSSVTKRYVKRIRTGDGYMFHIVIYNSKPYVSCGDVCNLIWSNKESDYLLQRLQDQESVLNNTLIWESQNEDMFEQLQSFHVKGFQELNDQTCILVYPLNTLVQILNTFGHPSAELRRIILKESSNFDPMSPKWKEMLKVEFPEGEEEFAGKTDDDKLNRLCLYDLQTMKKGIRIRRQNLELQRSRSPDDVSREEEKLQLLYNKVVTRIKEIEQICSNFAEVQ